jgi:hypothetical protein
MLQSQRGYIDDDARLHVRNFHEDFPQIRYGASGNRDRFSTGAVRPKALSQCGNRSSSDSRSAEARTRLEASYAATSSLAELLLQC